MACSAHDATMTKPSPDTKQSIARSDSMQLSDRLIFFIKGNSKYKVVIDEATDDGHRIGVSDGKHQVECIFDLCRPVEIRGPDCALKALMCAWAGLGPEPPHGELSWAPFVLNWRDSWKETADYLSEFVQKHGMPSKDNTSEDFQISREILFHDFMFRTMSGGSEISEEQLRVTMRNWFNRFCFMGLDVEKLIEAIIRATRGYIGDTPGMPTLGVVADTISDEMCSYCSRHFIKTRNHYVCPQVNADQNSCAANLIDSIYPFSNAGQVIAYSLSNLKSLMHRNRGVSWLSLNATSPIEQAMAKGLQDAGLLYVPQYQATDHRHRYKIDFVIKTTKGPAIAIECDGLQFHANAGAYIRDRIRDRYLQKRGFFVMRFSSVEIFNELDKCVGEIDEAFWDFQRGRLTLDHPPRTNYFGLCD